MKGWLSGVVKRGRSIFLLSLISTTLFVPVAQAIDVDFFASNDILFYNPDLCQVTNQSGAVALAGNDVAEKLFRFFTTTSFPGFGNKPFNAIQAAGALGNFQQESSMNPASIEGGVENSHLGDGHGLAQWSYSVSNGVRVGPGRRGVLFNLASSQGKQWSDLDLQVTMIQNEINNHYGKSLIGAGFETVSTPKEASYIFQRIYESAGTPNQAKRDSAAQAYYEKFKNLAPSTFDTPPGANPASPVTGNSSSLGAGACPGGGTVGTASAYANDGFVIYNQFDPQWASKPFGSSTIAEAGCGPSTMAMIITALTGQKVTPADTTAYANTKGIYVPGAGSSWSVAPVLAQNWGLKAKNVGASVAQINTVLQGGGLIATSGKGASPFTSGGHYINIRGLAPSGKWLIGDSNGNKGIANSKAEWDPAYILSIANSGNIVAITK